MGEEFEGDEEELSEGDTIDQIIEALGNNQELLESDQELTLIDLRGFMADMNFALMEIVKKIKEQRDVGKLVRERFEGRTGSLYS